MLEVSNRFIYTYIYISVGVGWPAVAITVSVGVNKVLGCVQVWYKLSIPPASRHKDLNACTPGSTQTTQHSLW